MHAGTQKQKHLFNALDPHLKKLLTNLLKISPFNLLCDESNNRGASVRLLTILVRLFDPHYEVVVTKHLDIVGMTDLTAEGIFSAQLKLYKSMTAVYHPA